MYALTEIGYRALRDGSPLSQGETLSETVPADLISKIDRAQRRLERDEFLRSTDWTQMADAPLSAAQKTAWGVYRQALRDLPSKPGFPDVLWPAPPSLDGAANGGTAIQI